MSAPALPPDSLHRRDAARLAHVALAILPPDRIAAESARVPWDYPEREAEFLRAAVARGEAVALEVRLDGVPRGAAFGRILKRGKVRVFNLLGAHLDADHPAEVWTLFRAQVEEFARKLDCAWIEGETARPAVAASLFACGYLPTSVQFAKQLVF